MYDGRYQRRIPRIRPGTYDVQYRLGPATQPAFPNFLAPTSLHVTSDTGLQSTVAGPEAFTLPSPVTAIDRALGLTLNWHGMSRDRIALIAINFLDLTHYTRGICYCTTDPAAANITIPPTLLANFPQILRASPGHASLVLISWPAHPARLTAPMLDHAISAGIYIREYAVELH
jgi:hypothetical protein